MPARLESADLYARLGVPSDASDEVIRKAYRRLALTHHPDKGGDTESFKRCAEAYAVLTDPARRRAYDVTGDAALVDLEVDLDAMMADVFESGGLFEQMVGGDDTLTEMMESGEASMESMQESFASFMRHAMVGGGDGTVLMPDGSRCDAPKIKMPSLAQLMEDSDGRRCAQHPGLRDPPLTRAFAPRRRQIPRRGR